MGLPRISFGSGCSSTVSSTVSWCICFIYKDLDDLPARSLPSIYSSHPLLHPPDEFMDPSSKGPNCLRAKQVPISHCYIIQSIGISICCELPRGSLTGHKPLTWLKASHTIGLISIHAQLSRNKLSRHCPCSYADLVPFTQIASPN